MKRKKIKGQKGQVWLSDYTISLLIFTLAIVLSLKIIMNSFQTNNTYEELKADAGKISEILISEGYAINDDVANWTFFNSTTSTNEWIDSSDIIRPGLLFSNRLDSTKVQQAMNTTYITYAAMKNKLQTKYDFLVTFNSSSGSLINFNPSCDSCASPCGYCQIGKDLPSKYDDLVKLDRFVVFNSSVVHMEVYVWQD